MYTGGHQQLDFTDRNIAWDVARRHLFDMADMARSPSEKDVLHEKWQFALQFKIAGDQPFLQPTAWLYLGVIQ